MVFDPVHRMYRPDFESEADSNINLIDHVWRDEIKDVKRGSREERMLRMTLRIIDQWPVPGPNVPPPNSRLVTRCFQCCLLFSLFACDRKRFSELLRTAKIEAWRFLLGFAFPLIRTGARDVWVIFQTMFVIISFCLEVASISKNIDTYTALTSVGLVLSTVALVLSLVDVVLDFVRRCRRYYQNVKRWSGTLFKNRPRALRSQNEGTRRNDNGALSDPKQRDNGQTDNSEPDGEPQTSNPMRFVHAFEKYGDVVRSVISELLIYPLLIITIFQFIIAKGYDPQSALERFGLGLFCLNVVYLFLGVYGVRLLGLLSFIVTVSRVELPSKNARKFGQGYFILLLIHLMMQGVSQIVILAIIGVEIHEENLNSSTVSVSWQLWAIIVGGFFFPIFGLLMFFINTHYWIEYLNLGVLLGIFKLFEAKKFPNMIFEAEGINDQKRKELARKLTEQIRYKELLEEYESVNIWLDGIQHPYRNPFSVGLSVLYFVMLCGYFYCIFTAPGLRSSTAFITTPFIFIANTFTIQIVCFWISQPLWWVFTAAIVILAIVIISALFCVSILCLGFCGLICLDERQRRRNAHY